MNRAKISIRVSRCGLKKGRLLYLSMSRLCSSSPEGLTSSEASTVLSQELHSFTNNETWRRHWRRDFYRLLPILINSLFTLAAGLLLVVGCATGDSEYWSRTALLAALLLLFVVFNFVLVCREGYLLRTWHVSQLCYRTNPLLNTSTSPLTCPWDSSSYPSHPISTLRSQVTVPAKRDGSLINVPVSLLVVGDIIQCHPGLPVPATVTPLDVDTCQPLNEVSISVGEVLPPGLVHQDGTEVQRDKSEIRFTASDSPQWFLVTETPIIACLEDSLTLRNSSLEMEIHLVQSIAAYILIPAVFFVTFIINLIRYFALPEYFTSWQEVIISWPLYAILPLLCPSLQLVWTISSSFAVTKVSFLLESSHYEDDSVTCRNYCIGFWSTTKRFFGVVFQPSRYILPRVVEFFGNLTALSAVDKEYVLAEGLPIPEKVFFLRGKKSLELVSSKSSLISQKKNDGGKSQRSSYNNEQSTAAGDTRVVKFEGDTVDTDRQTERGENDEVAGDDSGLDATDDKSDLISSSSTESDIDHIEVITEVLDISSSPGTGSGLEFDDPNWRAQLDSLKPIGVNSLTTSHLLQLPQHWPPTLTTVGLRQYLNMTQCTCNLGVEVGISQYAGQFQQQQLLYLLSDTEPGKAAHVSTISRKGLIHSGGSDLIQPHLISAVFSDSSTGVQLLMSRGSGDVVAWCCCDFWDGKDLQPIGEMERMAILDFFNRRSLTSHCIALSYNPLLDTNDDQTSSQSEPLGVYVPFSELKTCLSETQLFVSNHSGTRLNSEEEQATSQLSTKSVLSMMCNQVFLGMVSLQYHPKTDIVNLVQALRKSGIRFIHFTAENELRGRVFAEKLGLEAGWNCHISLAPGTEDESLSEKSFDDSSSTSTASSLHSVINAFQSYIIAKLPKGIDEVRPHLANVDNVPLLVPLFTDCTPDAVRVMIQIMQENGEVVLCMGNPWVRDNLPLFGQAEIGLSLLPSPHDTCVHDKTWLQHDDMTNVSEQWPSPLNLAAAINSYTCDVCLSRDADVSIQAVVKHSRHLLGCMQRLLLFGFGCSLSIAIVLLISNIFFLPPPLSGGHVFWLVLFVIPILSLSLLSVQIDPSIKQQMPDRNKTGCMERFLLFLYFLATYLPSALVFTILFGVTLHDLCNLIPNTDCHTLLGSQNVSDVTGMSNTTDTGWLVGNRQGLVLAQDCICFLFTFTFLAISLRFIHRTEPFWRLWKYISWQYITAFLSLAILQIVYFTISQILESENSRQRGYMVWSLSQVPVYMWVFLILWPIAQILLQELLRSCDRRQYVKSQRRLRLSFETKLGMNSPF